MKSKSYQQWNMPSIHLKYVLFLLLLCISATAGSKHSIVKIYATNNEYDYENPWSAPQQTYGSGTGFLIEKDKILTVAHVVESQVYLEVQLDGDFYRYPAKIVALDSLADLALLQVSDKEFCNKTKPLEFTTPPPPGSIIQVLGYPGGGQELCVTQGVISRTEIHPYCYSNSHFLATQIDAPINPGNSGGPVMLDGKVVGMAFQGATNQQNINYMIPLSIIEHFLNDVRKEKISRFPSLGIEIQSMNSPSLRHFYNMKHDQSGVLVTSVYESSSASGVLQKGDIILSIDHVSLGNDGKVFYENNRVFFSHLFNIKSFEERVELEILRNGSVQTLSFRLTDLHDYSGLVPYIPKNIKPSYYIYGGIVFQPLTENFFHLWGKHWQFTAPMRLLTCFLATKSHKDQQLVILSKVLPDLANTGYQHFANSIIQAVNGKLVLNFQEFINEIENAQGEFLEITTLEGQTIILHPEECRAANTRIMENYHIYQLSRI